MFASLQIERQKHSHGCIMQVVDLGTMVVGPFPWLPGLKRLPFCMDDLLHVR